MADSAFFFTLGGGKTTPAALNAAAAESCNSKNNYFGQINPQIIANQSKGTAMFPNLPNLNQQTKRDPMQKYFMVQKNANFGSNTTSRNSDNINSYQSLKLEDGAVIQKKEASTVMKFGSDANVSSSQNIQSTLAKQTTHIQRSDIGNYAILNRSGASRLRDGANECEVNTWKEIGRAAMLRDNGASSLWDNGPIVVNYDDSHMKTCADEEFMFTTGDFSNDYFDKVFGQDFKDKCQNEKDGNSNQISQMQSYIASAFQNQKAKFAAAFLGFQYCQPAMAFAGGVPNFSPNSPMIKQGVIMVQSPFFFGHSVCDFMSAVGTTGHQLYEMQPQFFTFAMMFPAAFWLFKQPEIMFKYEEGK